MAGSGPSEQQLCSMQGSTERCRGSQRGEDVVAHLLDEAEAKVGYGAEEGDPAGREGAGRPPAGVRAEQQGNEREMGTSGIGLPGGARGENEGENEGVGIGLGLGLGGPKGRPSGEGAGWA